LDHGFALSKPPGSSGRLKLIRHLLDHVPDCRLPDEPFDLPQRGKLARERFRGPVEPIRGRF
jgi:hypothetical protein